MSDFYQHRLITTIHDLGSSNSEEQSILLKEQSSQCPISLIVPALFSEITEPGLSLIVNELLQVDYVHHVVVSMNRMSEEEYSIARHFFARLPQKYRIIWNDGPRIKKLYERLEKAGLTTYTTGKGSNVWMAVGYALAVGETKVFATHDSDILSYHREMLLRLCLPMAHPDVSFDFCKSYYGRVSDRMHGRVTRLLVTPLIRAMIEVLGPLPLLEYLDQFRYPLSGEFSVSADLAGSLRMPSHWGLEVGLLCETFHNTGGRNVCQIDLGSNYDHKHQEVGLAGATPYQNGGLTSMVKDIALTLYTHLSAEGGKLEASCLKEIRHTYLEIAKESIERYHDDSILNGLPYYRLNEMSTVEAFERALWHADGAFIKEDFQLSENPTWDRVLSVLPDFGDALIEAVECDHRCAK